MHLQIEHLPRELRELDIWVVQRDKAPFNPRTGGGAMSSNPYTWAGFPRAFAAGLRGAFDGLSCAVTPPRVAIDFDHCVDVATGAIDTWAASWLTRLDSYSEFSPSGTGIHVWVHAHLVAACKKPRAELYGSRRFMTMTGDRVPGTPATIEDRQDGVDALLAELRPEGLGAGAVVPVWADSPALSPTDLRSRAAAGRIRRTTLALLDSTGPDGYPSTSEADSVLACGLVGAGLTADEILALLLDSARGRDAFTRKGERHAVGYLRRTIDNAARHVGPVMARPNGVRVRRVIPPPPRKVQRVEALP